ncbi:hypothetical protein ACFH04_01500 [Streptomyces noboritoensis]|uniref:Uncharacterized protein n=1 Tax=Streptomyces noboritoensis TaxID=67337 RepID=A0ABV6TD62_9ACTN|nr:hypothetical protein GCM10010278_73520 [Streptomyces melanogenes]
MLLGPSAYSEAFLQGNRRTHTDSTGTTLYLPGGNELLMKSGAVTGTRYCSYSGKTVAVVRPVMAPAQPSPGAEPSQVTSP